MKVVAHFHTLPVLVVVVRVVVGYVHLVLVGNPVHWENSTQN